MQKRPFALLEVVIALAILALSAPLLVKWPFQRARQEKRFLATLKGQRYSTLVFPLIVKHLTTRHPKWDFPNEPEAKETTHSLSKDLPPAFEEDLSQIRDFFPCPDSAHYHLYYHHGTKKTSLPLEKKNVVKLWCVICLTDSCQFKKRTLFTRSKDLFKFPFVIRRQLSKENKDLKE